MTQEHFPKFFEQAPTLTVQDALAEFLGAAEEGIMQYRSADAVRLCGHSCPTVAGAYLMTLKGLKALYGSDLPQRGGIEAAIQGARDEGTVGVTASVVQLLTGAAPETGFGGIGHHTIEDDGIGDEPAFDDLAQSRSQLLDRQCLQSGHIAHDGGRRMEGTH